MSEIDRWQADDFLSLNEIILDDSDIIIGDDPSQDGASKDLEQSVNAARNFFGKLLNDPETAEILAQVMDGTPRMHRSSGTQNHLDDFINDVAENGVDIDVVLVPSDATLDDRNYLPPDVPVALILEDDGGVTALVSNDLGFRSMILLTQEAFAQALVLAAEQAGILMTSTQDTLFFFRERYAFDNTGFPLPNKPAAVNVRFDGETVVATPISSADSGLRYAKN